MGKNLDELHDWNELSKIRLDINQTSEENVKKALIKDFENLYVHYRHLYKKEYDPINQPGSSETDTFI